jgi:hypothetical protein
VGAIAVFAVIVALLIVFYQVEARQREAKDVESAYGQASQLTADQRGRLASYGWVDQEDEIVHLPIKRAMDLVAAELSRNPDAPVTGVVAENGQPDDAKEDDGNE